MDEHALERLEYGKVLDRIASRCMLAMGAAAVRSLRPTSDAEEIRTRAERVAEAAGLVRDGHDFAVERFEDPCIDLAVRESAYVGQNRIGSQFGSDGIGKPWI